MNTILFSKEVKRDLSSALEEFSFSRLFVLVDENTATHCLPLIKAALPESAVFFKIAPGERYKNLQTCASIWEEMTNAQLDRKALSLNLGGGVIGDMGGFCASIYKRGIRFINLPTTLLSQVDASVGGKLGVDFQGLKNHLGVFNQPEKVIIASQFLATLPEQELRSGFAEVIKHGLIQDRSYFEKLDFSNWQSNSWPDLIRHSVEIKNAVVEQDPKESGIRKILNFGHTIGHAVETFFLDGPQHLLHGEAISVGMICEAWLSVQKSGLPEADLKKIESAFLTVFGKAQLEESHIDPILNHCLQDKKNEGNTLMFSLLESIGSCNYNVPITADEIRESINYYRSLPTN